MGPIQSSINSIISSASHAIMGYKAIKKITMKEGQKTPSAPSQPQGADAAAEQVAMQHLGDKGMQQIEQNARLQQHKALVENYNKGMFQNLPIETQQKIAAKVSEIENEESI